MRRLLRADLLGRQGVMRHTTPAPAVRNTTPHGLPPVGPGGSGAAAMQARSGLGLGPAAMRKRKADSAPGFR